jgi:hypothetical protein
MELGLRIIMALIKGQEVQEGPKDHPANPRLWNMITAQARSRFAKYPSPAAAHWVRSRYSQMGGQFVASLKDVDPKMRDTAQEEMDAKEEKEKERTTKNVTKKVTKRVKKPV